MPIPPCFCGLPVQVHHLSVVCGLYGVGCSEQMLLHRPCFRGIEGSAPDQAHVRDDAWFEARARCEHMLVLSKCCSSPPRHLPLYGERLPRGLATKDCRLVRVNVEPIPRQFFLEVVEKALQVVAVLAPKICVVEERSPRFGGGGAPCGSGGWAGALERAVWRSLAIIAPKRSGESGEPCRMPFDWGTGVMTSPTATFKARVSSRLSQRSASHGWSPPCGLAETGSVVRGFPRRALRRVR